MLPVLRAAACLLLLVGASALAQQPTTAAADPVPAFENMPAGSGKRFEVTVRNTGGATLRTTGLTYPRQVATGNDFCKYQDIAPSSSCTIELIFIAIEPGQGTANILVHANVAGGEIVVPIAWRIDPYPIETSTRTLVFEQQIGAAGPAQTVRVANIGAAPYDVSFEVTPDTLCWFETPPCLERRAKEKASYDVVSSCGTLAPGQACDIAVRFAVPTTPRDVVRTNLEINMGGTWARVKLVGAPLPPQTVAGTIAAIEYVRYYADTVHYFLTVSEEEKGYLDTGRLFGWQRTGEAFWVYPPETLAPGTTPVCRYYGRPEAGLDSHFYSASPAECAEVARKFGNAWIVESEAFFRVTLPDFTTGACPASTSPVYRLYNNKPDVNHVYTTSLELAVQFRIYFFWVGEGYGPDAVAMCVPQ